MNEGVENNTLTPMEGVKIAPVTDAQVDASNKETASSSVGNAIKAENKVVEKPTTINSAPVITNTTPVEQPQIINTPQTPPTTPVVQQEIPQPVVEEVKVEKPKKKLNLVPILILLVIGLFGYIVYSSSLHKKQLANLSYNCTPITASKEDIKLELGSTLVQDLYNKVRTSIREDLAQPEFNDNMKLYLAYRQILEEDKYDSNCNMFDNQKMEPYTCQVSTNFKPKAFKEDTMKLAIKKLFGERTNIPLNNIQLGNRTCIGGYQYIPNRGEFVQGKCSSSTATSFKATKTLKEAISNRNTIILTEEVKYHENESMRLPDTLKSGIYYYTFRLDMNYNYVLVSKTFKTKY